MTIYKERINKIRGIAAKNRTVIFGAGGVTRNILNAINEEDCKKNIVGLVDSNPNKVGLVVNGIKIYSPQALEQLQIEYIIINVEKREHSNKIYDSIEYLKSRYQIIDLNRSIPDIGPDSEIPDVINFIRETRQMPILIYQMGKVGSSTIRDSLKQYGRFPWHVHFIAKNFGKWRDENKYQHHFPDLLNEVYGNDQEKIKIITLVRDPMARNLSAFFHIMNHHFPKFVSDFENGTLKIEQLIDFFFDKRHLDNRFGFNAPYKWFENELQSVFGIDLFKEEFPKDKGYMIYEFEKADVLLIKLEKLHSCISESIEKFLGIEEFEMHNTNMSENRKFGGIYKCFKKEIAFSEEYVNEIYNSKIIKHFYTNGEIAEFKKRLNIK